MKRPVTVLIKPASSLCNMACSYCFYRDIADHREQFSYGIMSEETAAQLVRKTLALAEGGPVTYCFQGGEPLIAGIEFYRRFLALVEQSNEKKSPVAYALQTNGLLIDEAYCEIFRQYRFLLGVSLDGRSDTHNRYRLTVGGKGTFNRVVQNIDLLRRHGIDFNILSVVTKASARNIRANWNFFRKQGYGYLQFITCLEPMGCEPFSTQFAMNNEEYYRFHKEVFDLYLEENQAGRPVSVRHLDNLMARLHGQPVEQCDMQGRCVGQLVVEADGSVYPCDFYCEDQYKLGNIRELDLETMQEDPVMQRFVQSSMKVDEACQSCEVRGLCRGGCRRERDYMSDGDLRRNMYCEGRRKFYGYVLERLHSYERQRGKT